MLLLRKFSLGLKQKYHVSHLYEQCFTNNVIDKLCLLFDFQLGTEMGVHNPAMKTMKTVMRILAVAMIPLAAQFPTVSLSLQVAWGVAEGRAEGAERAAFPLCKNCPSEP